MEQHSHICQHDCSLLYMARIPASITAIRMRYQEATTVAGELLWEKHSPTTRLLATVYVASTGIKKNHMRASPRWQQPYRGSCYRTTLPNNTIARDDLCREYRHENKTSCMHYQEGNNRSGGSCFERRSPTTTSRIACVHYQGTNNRSGEAVVEQHSRTTRLLATICFLLSRVPASNRLICVHNLEATFVMGKPLWNDAPQQHP